MITQAQQIKYMQHALELAQEAYIDGEIPVGCIIVQDNHIIARARNTREKTIDPTGHAEIVALRQACQKIGYWRLTDCDLYVTLEPCVMCAGAIMQAHIRNLYFGAFDPKNGACGSNPSGNLFASNMNHHTKVLGGIIERECGDILRKFFRDRRQIKRK